MTKPGPSHEPAAHYNRVTAAWRLLLGDELHYGVFDRGDEPLAEATAALTARMVAAARLAPGLDILDVGCGTGGPACELASRQGVNVLGITTSSVGVADARARADARGLADRARFELRDGTDNGLPDVSFDRVWVLEASHLMPAHDALIRECVRVLRPGGRLALCDIIRMRDIPFDEVRARRHDLATLREAFGDAHMHPLRSYTDLFQAEGLQVDVADDLTIATLPTFRRWREMARLHHAEVTEAVGADGLDAFVRSTHILEAFWNDRTLGYGLIAGTKPAMP